MKRRNLKKKVLSVCLITAMTFGTTGAEFNITYAETPNINVDEFDSKFQTLQEQAQVEEQPQLDEKLQVEEQPKVEDTQTVEEQTPVEETIIYDKLVMPVGEANEEPGPISRMEDYQKFDFGGGIQGRVEAKTLIVEKTDSSENGRMNDFDSATSPVYHIGGFENIVIGEGVEYIGAHAFEKDPMISTPANIQIGKSVKEIGAWAFNSNIVGSITFDSNSSLEKIDTGAFHNNSDLKSEVIIPDSVKIIEGSAFKDCDISKLTIGSSVEHIGGNAFDGNKLTELIIPNNVKEIEEQAFRNNDIANLVIGEGITEIAPYTFIKNELVNISIPNQIEKIGSHAFESNKLESLVIDGNVKTICGDAFSENKIKSVVIGDSVETIGECAFLRNEIDSLVLGKGLKVIGAASFGMNKLTTLKIPGNVSEIQEGAFFFNDIVKIQIGDNTTISEDLKDGSDVGGTVSQKLGFKEVYDVQAEKAGTYNWNADSAKWEKQAPQKTEFDFGGGVVGKLKDGILTVEKIDPNGTGRIEDFESGKSPINSVEGITDVVVGQGVTYIGSWAFSKASDKITGKVIIGDSVEEIGLFAFNKNDIREVKLGSALKKICMGAFMENRLAVVNFPDNVKEIREAAFWANPISEVRIGANVDVASEVNGGGDIMAPIGNTYGFWRKYTSEEQRGAGKYTFNYDEGKWERQAEYSFGGGITGKLENGNFKVEKTDPNGSGRMNDFTLETSPIYALQDIKNVIIGDGVEYIGKCAFCKDQIKPITGEIVIGGSVKVIGEKAFYNNQISSLILGENIETIEKEAFWDSGLNAKIVIPNSVKVIKESAFSSNQISEVVIGSGVTEIGNYAFKMNTIESIVIPDTVKILGQGSFSDNSIKTASIGKGIEVISKNAFAKNKLESIVIGENVISINETAFNRNKLKEVTFNEKLESIGLAAFSDNKIQKLKIGNNVKTICENAFVFNQIQELELGDNIESIEPYVFGFNNIKIVKLPSSIKSIGKGAFYKNPVELIEIGSDVKIAEDEIGHGPEEGNMSSPTGINIGFKALYDSENIKEGTYMWNNESSKWEKKVEEKVNYDFGGGITGKLENGNFIVEKTDSNGSGEMNDFQIGKSPIFKTEGIKSITIGEGVKSIGKNAFNYKSLENVVLGKDVEKIGESAFKGCGLKSVVIPENVKLIDIAAFAANDLTYIKLPDSIIEVGEAAFHSNPLTKIDIGDKVKIKNYLSEELKDIDTFGNNIGFKAVYENESSKKGTYNWNKETSKWEKYVSKPSGGGSSGGSGGGSTSEAISIPVNTANEIKKGIVEVKKIEEGKGVAEVSIVSDFIKDKILDISKQKDSDKVIKIEVSDTTLNIGKYIFDADVIKSLSESDCTIAFGLGDVKYKISAQDLDIKDVMKKLNITEADLSDVKLSIEIEKLPKTYINPYEAVSAQDEFITEAVEFDITASNNTTGENKSVDVKQFADYVEREVEIPEGVDPSKITTGVVLNENGTYSHIPTEVFEKNGKYYAKINSLTNSAYSVIWNPVEVKSVKGHWSESAVNDMASRLIIKDAENFKADNAITRADFADYIVRALGLYRDGDNGNTKFADVNASSELATSIKIASDRGIINGYPDGTFRPNENITRQEAMAMYAKAMDIVNLDEIDNSKIDSYKDRKQIATWAYDSVQKAVGAGVFNGRSSSRISPKGTFTYAEAATAIRNLLVKSNLINN